MSRILKIIELNKPDPAYVSYVLAQAFIKTHGAEKVRIAIDEIKKRDSK